MNRISLIVVFSLFTTAVFSQAWEVPADQQFKTAPFIFDAKTKAAGQEIYQRNCMSCHGTPGKGNMAKMNPIPKDPASKEYQANTDGNLFFKLTTGKGPMPSFAMILTPDQRWQVISFVRSFNASYKQGPINSAAAAALKNPVTISFSYTANKISLLLINSDKKIKTDLSNIAIKLYVKRAFGDLLIGESTSNNLGIATFNYQQVPGDTLGNIELIARLTMANGNELSQSKTMAIGKVIHPVKLLDERTMWNVSNKTPIWLLVTYVGGVLAVFSVILFILLQLKKIKDINSKPNIK